MRKTQKSETVKELQDLMESSSGLLLLSYRGVPAPRMDHLRSKLREVGCATRVVKNTLLQRALEKTPFQPLTQEVSGALALVVCGDNLVPQVKAVMATESEVSGIQVKAGFLAGLLRTRQHLQDIANLPSTETLLAQLIGVLQNPLSQIIQALQNPMRNLIFTLQSAAKSTP